ncbi:GerAB/ArcD/ProY family transporter [Metabacillus niabensis]|uniref:GerAB/ArcD/ProY family transporter n=1 Tax=Metabacillus niabensis TaxID=324854 RepID=UPI001CF966CD|nr:GerAB/ArcD/ProY family transporter [Metabacillus niabensis]
MQLFILIFHFEVGSSIVVGVGLNAKQDAWLAILLALIGGILLFLIYFTLFKQHPNKTLTEYLEVILGKYIGKIVAFIYILYFFYIAGRVLRDFGDLIITTTLDNTPLLMVNLIVVLLVLYSYHLGLEVIARAGSIFFIILLTLALFFFISAFIDQLPKFENLLPVLEKGWEPVLKTVFPLTLTFPFGEIIVFTMIFPLLNRQDQVFKAGLTSLIFSGILLMFTMTIIFSVLGPTIGSTAQFPLMEAIEKVNIANFIQRLDPIALGILIIGIYFKITIFYFGALYGFEKVFKLKKKKRKYLLFLTGGGLLASSIYMAEGLTEHLRIGLDVIPLYVHIPLQVCIPLVLFLISTIKVKMKPKST